VGHTGVPRKQSARRAIREQHRLLRILGTLSHNSAACEFRALNNPLRKQSSLRMDNHYRQQIYDCPSFKATAIPFPRFHENARKLHHASARNLLLPSRIRNLKQTLSSASTAPSTSTATPASPSTSSSTSTLCLQALGSMVQANHSLQDVVCWKGANMRRFASR